MPDPVDRANADSELLQEVDAENRRREADKLKIPSGVTHCEECGVDITARTQVIPAAKYCVEHTK